MATESAISALPTVSFETHPSKYRHWRLTFDGPIATLGMDVQEDAGLSPDYKLKLNSYDLGVDIELADAITRLRVRKETWGETHVTVLVDPLRFTLTY